MKTNFKKLALTAGVSAVLAAGSMSAHAIIQAVPGGGQLVPLFVWNGNTNDIGFGAGAVDTVLKIIVPKSVGVDTLTNYLNPTLNMAYSVQDFNTIKGSSALTFPGSPARNNIHWTFLNVLSEHVINGDFPVTPDDVYMTTASRLLQLKYQGNAGYLVLQTNTSYTRPERGADFAFAADAWLTTPGTVTPSAVNIPTLPLADGPDVTTYPTTFNNIISRPVAGAPMQYPVVSPIISGIRTGAVPTQSPSNTEFSVIDLSLANRGPGALLGGVKFDSVYENILVVWNDRNGITAFAQEFDEDEVNCSTTISLPYQLNVIHVNEMPQGISPLAGHDAYKIWNNAFGVPEGEGLGSTDLCMTQEYLPKPTGGRLSDWGFLRLTLQSPVNPDPTSTAGAFSSAVGFTIPRKPDAVTGQVPQTPMLLGIERGFFGAW
jgi:hypothetical protein